MNYPGDILNKVCIGDNLEVMRQIPDNTVQACITSPPYWALRNYQQEGQIGLEDSPEEYTRVMNRIFQEVWRILHPSGTLWLNLGDTYSSQKGKSGKPDVKRQAHRYSANQTINVAATTMGGKGVMTPADRPHPSLKPKDLVGIPWRIAFGLQGQAVIGKAELNGWSTLLENAIRQENWEFVKAVKVMIDHAALIGVLEDSGWYLRNDIIWRKPNPMPESVDDRCSKAHEYLFLFSKSQEYYFDAVAIREPVASSTIGRGVASFGGKEQRKHKPDKGDPEYRGGHEQWGRSYDYQQCSANGRNKRSVWTVDDREEMLNFICDMLYPPVDDKTDVWDIVPEPFPGAHFAVFPQKLVEPCILAGTSEGGCCPQCRTPWVRMIEKIDTDNTQKMPDGFATHSGSHSIHKNGREKGQPGQPVMVAKTLGWRPDCFCDDWTCENEASKPVKCIVIDPFGGTGTTGKRSEELGRDWIHIDLGYERLARDRLSQRNLF